MTQDAAIHLPFFVLDVLRHDEVENLESIVALLNDDGCIGWRRLWGTDFTKDQVIPCLIKHIKEGNITPCAEDPAQCAVVPIGNDGIEELIRKKELWFHLTELGRGKWNEWQPPKESGT